MRNFRPVYPRESLYKKKIQQENKFQEDVKNELGEILKKTFPYILKDDQIYQNYARFVTIYHPIEKIVVYEWFNASTPLSVLKEFVKLFFRFDTDFTLIDRQYDQLSSKPWIFNDTDTLKDVNSRAKATNNTKITNSSDTKEIVLMIHFG